ncbi:MAG: hypothetical protein V2I74_13580 [Erythrobacter sp.]|nr:hypothetical protein [Erythrobacter sp.]
MSDTLARLDAFFGKWRERLCGHQAEVRFVARPLDALPGLHSACADSFVTSLGYQPIGANWELLDAEAAPDGARSAAAALVEAFAHDMALPQQPWLGEGDAQAMAGDFLACFDPRTRQIVTNRMYFGWNPLTDAAIEWAFVAFDDTAIALLLATSGD